MNWENWSKNLDTAYRIYDVLYGKPKTHREWAEGFNIRGKIIDVLNNGKVK